MTLARINGEVTRQAAMIGYLDDFRLMMYVCLAAMPIILLLRSPHKQAGGNVGHAVME
jgi:DHA2 family multidrug resistance protein